MGFVHRVRMLRMFFTDYAKWYRMNNDITGSHVEGRRRKAKKTYEV